MPVIGRIKKVFTKIPESLGEVVSFIAKLAAYQREINALRREAKQKIEAINLELKQNLIMPTYRRDACFNALFAFAQPRKEALTEDARSVTLENGTFGWRFTPPAVIVTNGMSDTDLVSYFERRDLSEYVRVVKEVNREALLRDKPTLPMVRYLSREEFFAKPKLLRGEGSAEELATEAIDLAKA